MRRRRITVAEAVRTWRCYAGARIRGEISYRSSFVIMFFGQILANSVELLAIWAVFRNTKRLGGWTGGQVMWLYCVTMLAFGLADLFASSVEELPELIRSGRFDSYLLRPTPVLISVLGDCFELRRLGKIVPGVACLVALLVHPQWFATTRTFGQLFGLVVAIVVGALIFSAIFVAMNSIAFWLLDSREVANACTYGGRTASQYPLDILSPWLRRIFTWGVPVAFVAFLPATRLLLVPKPQQVPSIVVLVGPLAAVAMWSIAGFIWRSGVRRYESVGS
jgi:ABC-2 type transport system permease protein